MQLAVEGAILRREHLVRFTVEHDISGLAMMVGRERRKRRHVATHGTDLLRRTGGVEGRATEVVLLIVVSGTAGRACWHQMLTSIHSTAILMPTLQMQTH